MSREKDGYRDNLELLNLRFPHHDMLTVEETMQVTGYKKRDTIMRHMGEKFIHNRISKVFLARYMCGK